MIAIRAAKVALVAAIALFASLVAFGNLTDYDTNFVFVQHVLSMDTIYPSSTIKYRAITSSGAAPRGSTRVIIAAEAAIGRAVLDRRGRARASHPRRARPRSTGRRHLAVHRAHARRLAAGRSGFMWIGGE